MGKVMKPPGHQLAFFVGYKFAQLTLQSCGVSKHLIDHFNLLVWFKQNQYPRTKRNKSCEPTQKKTPEILAVFSTKILISWLYSGHITV